MIYVAVLDALSVVVLVSWTVSLVAMLVCRDFQFDKPEFIRSVFHELRPLVIPAAVICYVVDALEEGTVIDGWRIFYLACSLFNWWMSRNVDDDDRWKRRREALAAKVQSAGHKLVVVPNA